MSDPTREEVERLHASIRDRAFQVPQTHGVHPRMVLREAIVNASLQQRDLALSLLKERDDLQGRANIYADNERAWKERAKKAEDGALDRVIEHIDTLIPSGPVVRATLDALVIDIRALKSGGGGGRDI